MKAPTRDFAKSSKLKNKCGKLIALDAKKPRNKSSKVLNDKS